MRHPDGFERVQANQVAYRAAENEADEKLTPNDVLAIFEGEIPTQVAFYIIGCDQPPERDLLEMVASVIKSSKKAGIILGRGEERARQAYSQETANDPTIHCNRFPSWDELSEEERTHRIVEAVKGLY
jgi:hypothetical protein